MQRNVKALTATTHDVLVIGGGIYGACVAWEATLRGLSVALVEKADFGGATSANSLKIIHGGLRYLQNLDFKRMRESIHERTALMQIAPHLVHPLPVLIPTYGHGMKGKEALTVAMALNDLISCDRNRNQDRQKHISRGRMLSRHECQQLLPAIDARTLTGGALFTDAQVYNSERLTLAFIRSAAQAGAAVANYVEVSGFIEQGDRITGVRVQDVLADSQFEIRARTIVNTSGPWINQVLGLLKRQPATMRFARAMNLVIRRPLFGNYAVGISHHKRFLFVAPWRERSLIGTAYAASDRHSSEVTEKDIQEFLDNINEAYPPANLVRKDVSFVHSGLLPMADVIKGEPLLAKSYRIYDHSQDGYSGLLSVTGVKYTTARDVAQKVVDRIFQRRGQTPPSTSTTPLYGGQIEQFDSFMQQALNSSWVEPETMRRLVYNYGSAYPEVLRYVDEAVSSKPIDDLAVLRAEVVYAVREEMAQTLSDIVFRRTELGTAGYPDESALRVCLKTLAALGWSRTKLRQEQQVLAACYCQMPAPNLV